ncbi:hypothetical protein FZC66_07035 [Priestia megaterium]|nr:hypothetical protein FZC66_07035 [Priestia megaterium]
MFDLDFTRTGTTSGTYTFSFECDDFQDAQVKRIKKLIEKDHEANQKIWHAKKYFEHQAGEFADTVKSKLEASERSYTMRVQQYDVQTFHHIMSLVHSIKDLHKRDYEIQYKESMNENELK